MIHSSGRVGVGSRNNPIANLDDEDLGTLEDLSAKLLIKGEGVRVSQLYR